MWRGRVMSAIRGRRGQRLLRDIRAALDAMPVKELCSGKLINSNGQCCALGAVARYRKLSDIASLQPENEDEDWDWGSLGSVFDIAECLAREVMYLNDEGSWSNDPAERWTYMRLWVDRHIKPDPTPSPEPRP